MKVKGDLKSMKICFDKNWLRYIGDIKAPYTTGDLFKAKDCFTNGAAENLDDSKWSRVTLPDDYLVEADIKNITYEVDGTVGNVEGKIQGYDFFNGSKVRSTAWYRKHFTLPDDFKGKRVFVDFDGVMRNSTLYLNEFMIGSHKSGYCGFSYDITDFLNQDGENILAMRVDPSEVEGWWYQGAGIYRHVFLRSEPEVYFVKDELFAKTKLLVNKAVIEISGKIFNNTPKEFSDKISIEITTPDNKKINDFTDVYADGIEFGEYKKNLEIKNPVLWDLDSPNIYNLTVKLNNGAEYQTTFGFRDIKFDKDNGFLLNGRKVELKGVCLHQDFAGAGTMQLDPFHEYRIQKLKEIGCNAIRSSHNPPTVEFLDACDRLGMLVMDETRVLSSSEERLAELEYLVKRDRNHPSIILWSIGNEERRLQRTPCAKKITETVVNRLKKLHPEAAVTEAYIFHDFVGENENNKGICRWILDYCDVIGLNYARTQINYLSEIYPEKTFILAEDSSLNSTRGVVQTDENKSQLFLQYDGAVPTIAKMCATIDKLNGCFYWTGFDYLGEPTPFKYPAISSQFGILDLCGFKKDATYFYEAMWKPQENIYHLGPHWNPVKDDKGLREVVLFGKCDSAELLLNGVSLGEKTRGDFSYIRFTDVKYEVGELTAIFKVDGKVVAKRSVKTTLEPNCLVADKNFIGLDKSGRRVTLITVSTKDVNGNFVPTADENIEIVASEGIETYATAGDPASHTKAKSKVQKLFGGLLMIIALCDEKNKGSITIKSDNLNGITIKI